MSEAVNKCATSFGAVYDFYMERPRLSKLIGRVLWGIDLAPMYANIARIGEYERGAVIADVPCGGGLALRGVGADQEISFIGVDIDPKMLERLRQKAIARQLDVVSLIEADMRELPLADASVDHLVSFSGLHMINDPVRALAEFARVLKPGGSLVGSSFVIDGTRRKRWLWKLEQRRGIATPPQDREAVARLLADAGFDAVKVNGRGFVDFAAARSFSHPARRAP